MSREEKTRRIKITVSVWIVYFLSLHAAEWLKMEISPFLLALAFVGLVCGTFYYQFIQGRVFSEDD
jgi:hypothetical protein